MPLTSDASRALLTSLGNEARGLFSVGTNPLVDPAGFLANPDAPPLSQQPAKALGRFICRRWARFEGNSNNPAADRLYARTCGPYLDSIGEGVNPGVLGPPFSGGQCVGVRYRWSASYSQPAGTENVSGNSIIGPVTTRPEIANVSATQKRLSFTARRWPDGQPITWFSFQTAKTSPLRLLTFSVARFDNAPDTCGNPAPDYDRPRPIITLPPITPIFIDLPDIGPVNVDVELFPDGTIEVGSPTLDVDVTLPPPDATPGGEGGEPPGPGEPSAPGDTGPGGDDEGTVPPGTELVGLLVEVLDAPIGANSYANNSETVYRGIGYVRMGYPGRLAVDLGAAAVRSPQFFHAPVSGLTAWQVKANLGFNLRITPYTREV